MPIGSISAASLSQYVLLASNSPQWQQSLQSLQNSLASGDLNGAHSAFQAVQKLYQNSVTASGSRGSSNSQVASDLTAVGSALTSGDLTTAQSAFATLQGDLKTSTSPAQVTEGAAAAESVALVEQLLSTVNPNTASSSLAGSTNSILQSVYASKTGLNVFG